MNGIINVYKPKGLTSHDVVYRIRKNLKINKVGHTGTLDPGAEGVLPICIGKATRITNFILNSNKTYIAEIIFGVNTDTFDKEGKVLQTKESSTTYTDLKKVLEQFTGIITQKPPIYSAIKVKGKKLYQYAREGKSVDIPLRQVNIFDISIEEYHNLPYTAKLKISCSKGTYIRSLCNDIGEAIGCGAHMGELIRVQTGIFNISNAIKLEEIQKYIDENTLSEIILPIDLPLQNLPLININNNSYKFLKNGNILYQKNLITNIENNLDNDLVRIYYNDEFVALGEIKKDNTNTTILKPVKVFI